ncbi:hypothetical protein SINU_03555 [Sporolactobacillus inulinus CASD]|uniref:Uncharacterized protein n=1 Tax=Sporolactobacillus inulinus CASD TaxID=1069536 RepID=A0A0U1QRC3_9BACL|nr:hypothetical protein SINU_03555 [Sporolactobacillus inulinus CASD]
MLRSVLIEPALELFGQKPNRFLHVTKRLSEYAFVVLTKVVPRVKPLPVLFIKDWERLFR